MFANPNLSLISPIEIKKIIGRVQEIIFLVASN